MRVHIRLRLLSVLLTPTHDSEITYSFLGPLVAEYDDVPRYLNRAFPRMEETHTQSSGYVMSSIHCPWNKLRRHEKRDIIDFLQGQVIHRVSFLYWLQQLLEPEIFRVVSYGLTLPKSGPPIIGCIVETPDKLLMLSALKEVLEDNLFEGAPNFYLIQ